jgi:hypothetical protein
MIAAVPTDDLTPPAPGDATLAEILSIRARRATPRRLTTNIVAGTVAAAVLYLLRPTGWMFFFATAVCFAAYGCWGFADRQVPRSLLVVPQKMHGVWRAARAITAFIGVLAFASALFVVLGFGLGTIIS